MILWSLMSCEHHSNRSSPPRPGPAPDVRERRSSPAAPAHPHCWSGRGTEHRNKTRQSGAGCTATNESVHGTHLKEGGSPRPLSSPRSTDAAPPHAGRPLSWPQTVPADPTRPTRADRTRAIRAESRASPPGRAAASCRPSSAGEGGAGVALAAGIEQHGSGEGGAGAALGTGQNNTGQGRVAQGRL